MTKRSTDMGETWSPSVIIPGTWEEGWCVGQPTCAYDATRKVLVLQYQNSTAHREVNGVTLQVTSADFGATWSAPRLLDPFLGPYKGVASSQAICRLLVIHGSFLRGCLCVQFPGPGNGLVLSGRSKTPGRYLFAAWGSFTSNQEINDRTFFSGIDCL